MRKLGSCFAEWCRLGCTRSEYNEYREPLNRRNLDTVRMFSAVMIIVFCVLIGLFFYEEDYYRVLLFAGSAILTMPIFAASRIKYSRCITKGTEALVVCTSLVAYACSMLAGTTTSDKESAVAFICMLVLMQITFDIPPLMDLAMCVPAFAVFSMLSMSLKQPHYWQYDLLHGALALVVGFIMAQRKSRLQMENIIAGSRLREVNYELYHSSTTDELTGMSNRRQVFAQMDAVRADAIERGNYICCVVMDVDDFKLYNDRYGHPAGDRLLKLIGQSFTDYCIQHDLTVGRIGGEEFLAVWEDTEPDRCEEVAEHLRLAVIALDKPHEAAGEGHVVTVSAGACAVPASASEKLYYVTDKALYRAKEHGKNCSFRYLPAEREYRYIEPLDAKQKDA